MTTGDLIVRKSAANFASCFILILCVALPTASPAQTFTTLINFDNSNGALPSASPIQGLDGKFYGVTSDGGANSHGTVFKITPVGQLTTLYSFCPQEKCGYGANPSASLLLAADGDFYGATVDGGAYGLGEVFKITPKGTLTRLHSFRGGRSHGEGAYPSGALIQGTDGNVYGATGGGGWSRSGTIFKMTPKGKLTTLYSFCVQNHCTDGSGPSAGLFQATNGNFYGTTIYGGANNGGTVFGITPTGQLTTLYSFCAQTNCQPEAGSTTGERLSK